MMEETKELLRQLHEDHRDLTDDVIPKLQRRQSRLALSVRRWIIAGIVIVLVALFCGWRFADWAVCSTDRSRALSGPGNDRVSHLIGGAFGAALNAPHLSVKQRHDAIAFLDTARARYNLIPSDAVLAKQTDSQLVSYVQAALSVDSQTEYDKQSANHPVCTLWSVP